MLGLDLFGELGVLLGELRVYSPPKSSSSNNGRTSRTCVLPNCGSFGQRLAHSTASSRLPTSHSQYPATISLDSVNGPSTTDVEPPSKTTRAPVLLGLRPWPSSMMPALTSSSL